MTTKRKEHGRLLFYTRDSGGKHENTPTEYVDWAKRKAGQLGLEFGGTAGVIDRMIRDGRSESGDIYLDFGVAGNVLSRPGLDAFIERVRNDPDVSHVAIPRRNRLARPNHPMDGIRIEEQLRQLGVTIVFMDKSLPPRSRGERPDIAEFISAAIDYDRSSEDRRELAQKVLYAQLNLAKNGYSTGGRPPYGFRRWLVHEDGTKVRELAEGERVRMPRHHVVWLPGPESELPVIRRILELLETLPASRVAKMLTSAGVPTPDHGRYRTDNGVRHRTSGVWHATTITNIARNPLLCAVVEYGRRSMGDQLRCTPDGPRELNDDDFREEDKVKVIRNASEVRITAEASFAPLVDPMSHAQLLEELDQRGGTQRGKPRSRDPKQNPLGCRAFDMNCGWPMYRTPSSKSFRYKCGLYQQSHGSKCAHNHVDGPTAARFVLSCIRQRALSPHRLQKLERRIRELAAADNQSQQQDNEIARKRSELADLEKQRELAQQNLARATSDEQYQAVAAAFEKLGDQVRELKNEIASLDRREGTPKDLDLAVDAAMEMIQRLPDLAGNVADFGAAGELFNLLDAKLYLSFRPEQVKKRVLNKLTGGEVTFGDALPPIEVYHGPTARSKVKNARQSDVAGAGDGKSSPPEKCVTYGGEGNSLGNRSRGDRI